MRAIGVTTYGGPEALEGLDLEPEPLEPDEIRLAVTHAAVNPTDTVLRAGARAEGDHAAHGPDVPGMDVAGLVVEVGDQVLERPGEWISVGDRVMGVVLPQGQHGGYRADLVLPADSVTHVPLGVTDAEASTVPMNGITAWIALEALDLQPEQTLAVTGAAGVLGGYLVQIARSRGLHVLADAAPADRDLVTELGAQVVLERGDGFADAVRREFPDGVDALVDGAVQGAAVLAAVRDGGAVATFRGWEGDGSRDLRFHPIWVGHAARRRDILDQLASLVEKGDLTPRVAEVLPSEEAATAHRRLEAGGVRGRLVLDLR